MAHRGEWLVSFPLPALSYVANTNPITGRAADE
jgi:hypothetical protein